jgi:hypothetical protein
VSPAIKTFLGMVMLKFELDVKEVVFLYMSILKVLSSDTVKASIFALL